MRRDRAGESGVLWTAALVGSVLALAGCSAGVGGAGSYAFRYDPRMNAGVRAAVRADFPVFPSRSNVSVGLETRLLRRVKPTDRWGQWRIGVPVGLTHMPQRHECFVGYEAFFVPGWARYHGDGEVESLPSLGIQGGLPLRLVPPEPPWRADDLADVSWYLVPSIGVGALGFRQVEATVGLSIRMRLWSAMLP